MEVRSSFAGDSESALEMSFRLRRVSLSRLQRDFAGDALGLGLEPSFLGRFDRAGRFGNAAPSIIDLVKIGMGNRQIG